MSGRVSILLLTEDSGEDGARVLRAVVERTLRLLDPQVDLERVRLVPAEGPARQAMNFNGWASPKGPHAVALARAIATQLARTDGPCFAILHVDGDMPWSASERGARWEKAEACATRLLPAVAQLLRLHGQEERLANLHLLIPYRHMESWLFQSFDALQAIYARRHPQGHPDLATISRWREDPGELDEVHAKSALSIGSAHNLELAGRFPTRRVDELGRSYHHAVERLRASPSLREALQTAHFGP